MAFAVLIKFSPLYHYSGDKAFVRRLASKDSLAEDYKTFLDCSPHLIFPQKKFIAEDNSKWLLWSTKMICEKIREELD